MKQFAKRCVVAILGYQTRRLLRKHNVTVIGVAGSIGKTSTKFAISQLLGSSLRVRSQDGNYNDIVTVPLVIFGHHNPPNLLNPLAWFKLFLSNERQTRQSYPFDVVVLELGTDGPGQIKQFEKYLHLDIAVVTAIAPEHMEFFHTLQAVADEELSISSFADKTIVNTDLTREYTQNNQTFVQYGRDVGDYYLAICEQAQGQFSFTINKQTTKLIDGTYQGYSDVALYSILAAVAIADMLGLNEAQIQEGLAAIKPAPGRMQVLEGINNSLLLDDTYNASPEAVKSALDTLYALNAPQKIALLGNMNELGDFSAEAHTDVGNYCDPAKVDIVLTLGKDANTYTAEAAKAKGCTVKTFESPYAAGRYLRDVIQPNAAVLLKGSQNGVFAEEALKYLLADKNDQAMLVRQSSSWLNKKKEQFDDFES